MERYLNQSTIVWGMSRGLSPIIATMLLVGITIAIGTIVSIWLTSQSQDFMNKEGERRERLLSKEGESLVLVHTIFDDTSHDLTLRFQNNGTSDLKIAYVKVNNTDYFEEGQFTCSPGDCIFDVNTSGDVTVTLPGAYDDTWDIRSVEAGTTLGNLFIYNAPTAQIRITNSFYDDAGNKILTFSGEGSTDDGEIVKWNWCFDYDIVNEVCNIAIESGAVFSYNYSSYGAGTLYVQLIVTDDTGMQGVIVMGITIQ